MLYLYKIFFLTIKWLFFIAVQKWQFLVKVVTIFGKSDNFWYLRAIIMPRHLNLQLFLNSFEKNWVLRHPCGTFFICPSFSFSWNYFQTWKILLKKQKNGYIFNPACESILIITVMDGNETDGAYGLPADRVFVELMGLDTLRDLEVERKFDILRNMADSNGFCGCIRLIPANRRWTQSLPNFPLSHSNSGKWISISKKYSNHHPAWCKSGGWWCNSHPGHRNPRRTGQIMVNSIPTMNCRPVIRVPAQ